MKGLRKIEAGEELEWAVWSEEDPRLRFCESRREALEAARRRASGGEEGVMVVRAHFVTESVREEEEREERARTRSDGERLDAESFNAGWSASASRGRR